jgi:hypothetical protein
MKLWGWFILPFGAPQISVVHAIGIGLLLSFMTIHSYDSKDKTTEEKIMDVMIIFPLWIVFAGWITQMFM